MVHENIKHKSLLFPERGALPNKGFPFNTSDEIICG